MLNSFMYLFRFNFTAFAKNEKSNIKFKREYVGGS